MERDSQWILSEERTQNLKKQKQQSFAQFSWCTVIYVKGQVEDLSQTGRKEAAAEPKKTLSAEHLFSGWLAHWFDDDWNLRIKGLKQVTHVVFLNESVQQKENIIMRYSEEHGTNPSKTAYICHRK